MTWTDCLQAIEARNAPLHPHAPAGDFHNSLLISPRYRYAYANNPKVACSTIRKLLIDAEFGEVRPFADRAATLYFKEFLPFLNVWQLGDFPAFINDPSVFKFTFVRNPYSRLLSGYLDKVAGGKPEKMNILKPLGLADAPETAIDFPTFVRTVCALPIVEQDHHWRVQYYQTFQAGISYDFIGRFESLEPDLRTVAERIGISDFITPETFGGAGTTTRQHATGATARLREFYTPELQELVYATYREDFVAFGYGEGLESP